MITTQQQRKPRFKRDSSVNFRLTERDLKIIRLVHEHRFLSSEHVLALVGGSRQGVLKRLHLLFHAGYLDRPKVQLASIGNRPMVYGLGNEGARFLAQELDLPLSSVDWTSKNREAKSVFLNHTLMVSNFMIMARLAARDVAGVEFIGPEEIAEKRLVQPLVNEKPLSWKAKAQNQKFSFAVVPDNAFGLRFNAGPKGRRTAYFFLEADRATMPIRRTNLGRSSFYKKMVGYWETWKQGLFAEVFGFKNPRVLTVTTSKERIQSMIEANKGVDPRGQVLRMFLFAPDKALDIRQPAKLFKAMWLNGRGEYVSIIE